ncbi:MAG TPA: aminotransferase class IV [Ferruginibacter sp.]|nr:aminotransferase class IV [Ferruginibacter sp.]HMP21540.1 aminotransferase class IV [Ferruginibacter sp.]
MPFINYNGNIIDAGVPVATAASRGLRYGDGLFETMKMLKGKIVHEAEHLQRLWHGMELLQFELRKHFSKEKLIAAIQALAQKNGHQAAARIRLNVCRGEGGLYDPANHFPNFIIETWPLQTNNQLNINGVVAGIYEDARKSCDILSNIKHNNYLPYVLAAIKAKKEKWNDALVLNQFGRIADSTISNIFIIKNEKIVTPPLAEGCVSGIMRQKMIQFLQKQYHIEEAALTIEDILKADEVMLTNSISIIRWVQQIQQSRYQSNMIQKIYPAFAATILG